MSQFAIQSMQNQIDVWETEANKLLARADTLAEKAQDLRYKLSEYKKDEQKIFGAYEHGKDCAFPADPKTLGTFKP